MYSYKDFIQNFDEIKKKLLLRDCEASDLDNLKISCEKLQEIKTKIIEINTEKNKLVKENDVSKRDLIKKLKEQQSALEAEEQSLSEETDNGLARLPNLPHESLVDKEVLVKKWWPEEEKKDFKYVSYQDIALNNKWFDLSAGANISGSGYVVYTGFGAQLFRALISFTLHENELKKYVQCFLPVLVNRDTLFGTAQLPKFEDDLFKSSDKKYLSPTSETQLVNLYRGKIISAKDLPIKLTANTNCFRLEAGSSGVDSSGIIRLHQFNKTEIVVICQEADSFAWLEDMLSDACDLLEKLKIPYRVIQLPYNDMSFASTKTYDIEVWFPSENRYREISSVSNTLAFQARRAKIRYKENLLDKNEKAKMPHILNGSALAVDRLFAALLENHQNKYGKIDIPEVLLKYLHS